MKVRKIIIILLTLIIILNTLPIGFVNVLAEEEHKHTEDCFTQTSELICSNQNLNDDNTFVLNVDNVEQIDESIDNQIMPIDIVWQGEVKTAQDLKDAIAYSADGETIVLGEEINYSQEELDTIIISKNVKLDFNGHKITVDDALFEIASTGSLTLINAQIESTDDDIIDTINAGGCLTIESTSGEGIVSADDIIADNYGTVVIKDGNYKPGYSLIYENYDNASVIIENANVVSGCYIIGYLENKGCSLEIKDGYYKSEHIISGIYAGNAVIEMGTFISLEDCVDDLSGGVLTIKGGAFTAGNIENNAYCFDIYDNGVLKIEDGEFTSTDCVVLAAKDAIAQLSGGIFTNSCGGEAFSWEKESNISITEGYLTDPIAWKESGVSKIRIYPNEFDVVFLDVNGVEYYRETIAANSSIVNWPSQPDSSSKGCRWWGWVDDGGTRYNSDAVFTSAMTLHAKFVEAALPDEPTSPEEPSPETNETTSMPEKPNNEPVVVTSYEELKNAIDSKKNFIRISGNIEFPSIKGTLNVMSDVYIIADEGTKLSGPGDMFCIQGNVEMTVEGMDAYADSNRVFNMSDNSVCNIISGTYSASDDVIMGRNSSTVNLFGGKIEERTGDDGPVYSASVTYKNHTKNISSDEKIIEVGPADKFTATLYDGDKVLKTIQVYETEPLCLPKIYDDNFIGWFDADGNQHYNGYIESDLTLYASYKEDKLVSITFIVDGEEHKSQIPYGTALSTADYFSLAGSWQDEKGFAWDGSNIIENDIVLYPIENDNIVKTFDELKAAIKGSRKSIVIGGEIPVTETLVIDRSVDISSVNGGSLIRPDGFNETLLSIESISEVTIGNLLIDGRNVEAQAAAVSVDSASTLVLKGTTIKNNWNMGDGYYDNYGGAIYSKGKVYVYEGTTLCSNKSYNGGAIDIDCEDETACLYLYGGDICHNSAWNTSSCEGAGGGVKIENITNGKDYVAFYMYGGRIHHNRVESSESGYNSECDGGGVSLTCGDDGIHFVMYDGSITDNFATGNGGGVYTGCSSMVMYDGLIARNVAEKNGGAVSTDCCDNTFYMYGGTITLNAAGNSGGGVDSTRGAPYTLLGNVYGNYAATSGDDIYASENGNTIRKVNDSIPYENLYYIASEMQDLYKTISSTRPGYIVLNPINGYEFTLSMPKTIQHMGWFMDIDDGRYVEGDSFIPVTSDDKDTTFKLQPNQDAKAIYGQFLLVYDANYGSGEYKYDDIAYGYGSNAVAAECMFDRKGYKFIGWNTKADGSGLWYYPDLNGYNSILMNSNKVVYAQWEKLYTVKYEVSGDSIYGMPTDVAAPNDDNYYTFEDAVTVSPNLVTKWETSDGTDDGIAGVWIFTPWDKEDGFLIKEDTIIKGSWTFAPSNEHPDESNDKDPSDSSSPNIPDQSKDSISSVDTYDKVPNTGDENYIGLWATLMLLSFVTLVCVCIYCQKKHYISHKKRK